MNPEKRKNKEYYISLIFITLSVIFWGYSFISTKVVLAELPPVTIAFFRQIIATVILFICLAATGSSMRLHLKSLWIIVLSGLFGNVLYFVFENNGLRFTTASNASMIVAAVPIFTLMSEVLFYKLKITLRMILCVLFSMAGVYLVITVNGKLDFSSATFLGNMLIIGAMAVWVVYTMLNKKLSHEYPGVLLTAYQSLSSVFLFIPFVIPDVDSWKMISPSALFNLVYLGVFCSAFGYFFYIYASKRLGATFSSAFLNLIPVVTVICGYLVLGEKLHLIQIAGMALIMFSLFRMSRK